MRIAVLSDVHGNLPALDAVLEHLADQQVDAIACLGDHVSGPVDPSGAAERLMVLGAVVISGNHDRWTVDTGLRGAGAVDRFAQSRLSIEQLDWLAGLPATATVGEDVFLCHGTPGDDETPWLDNFYDWRTTTLPDEAAVAQHALGINRPIMLCGHTHIARTVRLLDGRLIVNPGAVGMQLVRGSPDAHYAILKKGRLGWQTALMAVPYDTEAAGRIAAENGFGQWAASIRHGWAGPESLC